MSERLKLPLPFREKFKKSLWEIVLDGNEYEYYKNAKSRLTPQRLDRQDMYFNDNISNEDMENLVSQTYHIYSYHPIDDPEIRGSCEEFKTRKLIQKEQLKKKNLMEIEEL